MIDPDGAHPNGAHADGADAGDAHADGADGIGVDEVVVDETEVDDSTRAVHAGPVHARSGELPEPLRVVSRGLDPERPITPPPGIAPWQPNGERGVSRALPVRYGARSHSGMELHTGVDEIERRIGPVPAAAPVRVAEGRDRLPSLQRRDRRRRRVTLGLYAGLVIGCVLGLWGVASIAFG